MYAQCGKLVAKQNQGAVLAAILLRAAAVVEHAPGCRLYLVHQELDDPASVWVYEAWDDIAAHDASLQDARVRALIGEARPLIDSMPAGADLNLLGGYGVSIEL